jgi:hypothetical protein
MTMLETYKKEIERSGLLDKKSDYNGMLVGEALVELCETICKQGHSGFSFLMTIGAFNQLMTTNLLTPLQGTDDEWVDISEDCYQNNRRSSVFKDKKTGECYDIDGGPIFKDIKGDTYTCRDSVLHDIKFPYTPPKQREVVDDYILVKRDRMKSCQEFLKQTEAEVNAILEANEDNDSILFKWTALVQQELLMWARIAEWDNTLDKSDFDNIIKIRDFDKDIVNYLHRGLDAMGIKLVKKESK